MLLGSAGLIGHVPPVLALARRLRERDHEVLVATSERWRDVVDELGASFASAPEHVVAPGADGDGTTVAEAARSLVPTMTEFDPDVVVSDLFTLAPALAAEQAGVPRASLIHHPYPVSEPGRPPFPAGFRAPRTPIGAAVWRLARPSVAPRMRRWAPRPQPGARASSAWRRSSASTGRSATAWPWWRPSPSSSTRATGRPHVHVTGPMLFELPHPEVELPRATSRWSWSPPSTVQDPELSLVRTALEALATSRSRVARDDQRGAAKLAGPVPRERRRRRLALLRAGDARAPRS